MSRTLLVIAVGSLLTPATAAHAAAPANPLEARVTIDYRAAPAAAVIETLAAAAGLKVEIAAGKPRPGPITLTRVKPGTAPKAVCANAPCPLRCHGRLE